jgi:hypothetical protein
MQVVGEVELEREYRKPDVFEVFPVKLICAPYWIYMWGYRYYRGCRSLASSGHKMQ